MIPDYQTLMRPVLNASANGEVRIGTVVSQLADQFGLTSEERQELIPSGKQTKFANRVHWAKSYLKQAGLVKETRRAHFAITDRGRAALADATTINRSYLERFQEFKEFQTRSRGNSDEQIGTSEQVDSSSTPDEVLREAHAKINATLSGELLDHVRNATPAFLSI